MSTTYAITTPTVDPAEGLRQRWVAAGSPQILDINSEGAMLLALAQESRRGEIANALDRLDLEARHAADDRAARRRDALIRGLVPDSELTAEERSLIASSREEARQIAARYEVERPKRVEALLERIATALEGRR